MRWSALLCSLLFATACRFRQGPVMSASALYNIDSVKVAVKASGGDSTHWESYRLTADTSSSWQAATGTLKNILLRAPSSRGYFDLGLALLRGGQNPEAVKALEVARRIGYVPASEVWCRLAEAYGGIPDQDDQTILCMQKAIQLGCARPERFLQDKEYRGVYNSMAFFKSYREALASDWLAFKAGFKDLPLPLSIDTNWLGNHPDSDNAVIDPYYGEFVPAAARQGFARIQPEQFFYVGKVAENPAYIAYLYRDDFLLEAVPEGQVDPTTVTLRALQSSIAYSLATFTPAGKPIDRMEVAGHISWNDPVKLFRMDAGSAFTVSDFSLRHGVGNVRRFRIDEGGHFVKEVAAHAVVGGM